MEFPHLKGLIAAPFTPMYADGSINISIIPAYYEMLIANGVTGAFIIGSSGEGASLTLDEKKKVIKAWADCTLSNPDFVLMPLVGGTCLEDATALATYADQCGADVIAYTAPYYFKPPNVQLLADSCANVAAAVPDKPFYYYHIPVLNGVHLPMLGLLEAIDGAILNFAGIKYCHEDFMDFMSCVNYKGGQYDMLWSRDENLLPALAVGSLGAVGSTYNYAAPLYNDLIKAWEAGDMEKAKQLQQLSIDMIRLLGKYGGIATGKAYMKVLGLDCGEFRLPCRNMNTKEFESFQKDVKELGFASFCSRMPEGVKL